MLAILSPAKTLDYESSLRTKKFSAPQFVQESTQLIEGLRQCGPDDIQALMGISENLAELNHQRYAEWQPEFDAKSSRAAILAFKGDVYIGMDAQSMNERDFTFAQKHVRILSGLHGLLRPLDRIRPYRLEMGTRFKTSKGKDLYSFWGNKVTQALNEAIAEQSQKILINLASKEYYRAVDPAAIDARIIDVSFKELRQGEYRFLSFFAKKARGSMARYMIDHRVKSLKALREFDYDGYEFNAELSDGDSWVFTRLPQDPDANA